MNYVSYVRQQDIINLSKFKDGITVIGAGGIGSYVVLVLSKMGIKDITVYDHDLVENHNIPNQIYGLEHLEENKAIALQSEVLRLSGIQIKAIPDKFEDQKLRGIVISGVDSMASRRLIWQSIKQKVGVKFYIDGRMGGQQMALYAIRPYLPSDIKFYEQFMHGDDEVHEETCTARAIAYNTFTIAGYVGNIVKQFFTGENYPKEILFDMSSWKYLVNK